MAKNENKAISYSRDGCKILPVAAVAGLEQATHKRFESANTLAAYKSGAIFANAELKLSARIYPAPPKGEKMITKRV